MSVYITELAACLPGAPVPNESIEAVLGEVADRPSRLKELVLLRNGIKSRHYAIDPATGEATHSNAGLTAEAVRALSTRIGRAPSDIQLLACGTSSPDQFIPSHAAMVQGELGLPPLEIVSTAGVCASGMGAFKYAWLSVLSGTAKNAVVTGSELSSAALRSTHYQGQIDVQLEENPYLAFEHEFLRFMLSDGAGAAWLSPEPRPEGLSLRVDWLDILSYAGELETCMYAGGIKQADGKLHPWRQQSDWGELLRQGYFNLAQDAAVLEKKMVDVAFRRSFITTRDRHGMQVDDVNWLLPHLSSEVFRKSIANTLAEEGFAIPPERWFTNLTTKGNTGAASIFIMLEDLFHSGRLKKGERIMCVVPESARFTFAYLSLTVV
jgi:3-oxoacyl-[acyl-carrier-protein] synthase III